MTDLKIQDAFDEVRKATVEDKQVSVNRRSEPGEVRWTIIIRDRRKNHLFQEGLFEIFNPMKDDKEEDIGLWR